MTTQKTEEWRARISNLSGAWRNLIVFRALTSLKRASKMSMEQFATEFLIDYKNRGIKTNENSLLIRELVK